MDIGNNYLQDNRFRAESHTVRVPNTAATELSPERVTTVGTPVGRARPAGMLEAGPVQFLVWFSLILILKWPTLTQPPVWDGSMSVFPAAITLAENGFDLGYLLDQPGYSDGGPNVHSISLVTWLTAAVIGVVGDGPALFPVLHLIHFAVAAVAMVAFLRFSQRLTTRSLAWLIALAVLFYPLVLTQAGYLYLEFPLLAATALALLSWTRGNVQAAAAWSAVAALTKESGIIVAVALAFAALAAPRSNGARWRNASVLLVPALLITVWIVLVSPAGKPGSFALHAVIMTDYLTGVPDLLVLLIGFVVFSLLTGRRRARQRLDHVTPQFAISALVISFVGFYVALPLVTFAPVLPRYFIQIAPFMVLSLSVALAERRGTRPAAAALILALGLFVLNGDGRFYPNNSVNNFALLERSNAYVGLLELQKEGIRVLEDLETEEPIFYAQPEHYKLSYPLMGYAEGPLPTGISIRHVEPYRQGRLVDFPDRFYMLYEYPWLGGEIIRDVRRQAESDPDRRVEVVPIEIGGFRSELLHVSLQP